MWAGLSASGKLVSSQHLWGRRCLCPDLSSSITLLNRFPGPPSPSEGCLLCPELSEINIQQEALTVPSAQGGGSGAQRQHHLNFVKGEVGKGWKRDGGEWGRADRKERGHERTEREEGQKKIQIKGALWGPREAKEKEEEGGRPASWAEALLLGMSLYQKHEPFILLLLEVIIIQFFFLFFCFWNTPTHSDSSSNVGEIHTLCLLETSQFLSKVFSTFTVNQPRATFQIFHLFSFFSFLSSESLEN